MNGVLGTALRTLVEESAVRDKRFDKIKKWPGGSKPLIQEMYASCWWRDFSS